MIAPRHMLVAPLLLAVGLCTPNKGYANDSGDDPHGIGQSSPSVVRTLELALSGETPMEIDRPGSRCNRRDRVAAWWKALGRGALPALLRVLDPKTMGDPWEAMLRREAALQGLLHLVRRWDLPLLRALHEAGWRDVIWLQLALEDSHMPRHVALALERGQRVGAVRLAAMTYPHRLIDQALLPILDAGQEAMGYGASWMLDYVDRRQLTQALPALEKWIAELERGERFEGNDLVESSLMQVVSPPPRGLLDRDLWMTEEISFPPGRGKHPLRAWFVPHRSNPDDDWVDSASDQLLRLHVTCARLGSHEALLHIVAMTQPSYTRPRNSESWSRKEVKSGALRMLRHLIAEALPAFEDAPEALREWWMQHHDKLHFDHDTRTWSVR
ncbi:MAG: hypothetical protein AB7T63_05685 [Planctomycetota bacterium]